MSVLWQISCTTPLCCCCVTLPTCPDICFLAVQDAYSEVASLFAEFFRDLDIVPSDIIAGLVLLRQRQRSKRSAILDQVSVSIKYVNVYIFVPVYTCAVMKKKKLSVLFSLPKANNDILAFLSGMPVTRNTRYLDLKNSVSFFCDKLTKLRLTCVHPT